MFGWMKWGPNLASHCLNVHVTIAILVLDGNADHVAHVWRESVFFIFIFAIAVDLNKCLKQVKLPISLYTCTHISELPSNLSTMVTIRKDVIFMNTSYFCSYFCSSYIYVMKKGISFFFSSKPLSKQFLVHKESLQHFWEHLPLPKPKGIF